MQLFYKDTFLQQKETFLLHEFSIRGKSGIVARNLYICPPFFLGNDSIYHTESVK